MDVNNDDDNDDNTMMMMMMIIIMITMLILKSQSILHTMENLSKTIKFVSFG